MERIYAEGSPERDWEIEQFHRDMEARRNDRWEYERYEERRSIWEDYREKFQAENAVEAPEFRKPVGQQGWLFGEVA